MPAITTVESAKIQSFFGTMGIPDYIWYPIMMQESGGNSGSNATVGEDSRGLFQINIQAHPQWSNVDLYDPMTNATYAATYFILPAYKQAVAKGITDPAAQAEYVWRYGIKPNWKKVVARGADKALRSDATQVAGGKISPVTAATGGGSGTGNGTTSPVSPSLNQAGLTGTGAINFGLGVIDLPLTDSNLDMDKIFGIIIFLLIGGLMLGAGLFIAFGNAGGGAVSMVANLAGAVV